MPLFSSASARSKNIKFTVMGCTGCFTQQVTGSASAQTLASAAIRTPKLLAAPQREKRPFVVSAAKSGWAMTELWDKLTFDLDSRLKPTFRSLRGGVLILK